PNPSPPLRGRGGKCAGLALLFLFAAAPAFAGPTHVYKATRVWTGSGPPVANAILVVRDGKVVAVGPRDKVTVPDDAEVHDLGAAVLIPGLVIAETTLGEGGRDDERALTPEFRAIDGFDFYGDYRPALSGGVTTVQIAPGSRRLMPGQGAVVKLAGDGPEARTLRESESLRVVLGDAFKSPPRVYEPPVGAVSEDKPLRPTRHQLSASLGAAVAGLRATFRAAKAYDPAAVSRKDKDESLAAVAGHMKNGGRVRVTAPGAADIRAALTLAREFNLHLLLVDPSALAPFREELPGWKDTVTGVVLNAEVRPGAVADLPAPGKNEPARRLPWENARDLLAAGQKVAIRPAADGDLADTLFVGGLFTRDGLPAAEVLRMLTLYPAEILGVSDRVGSLAAGKDADFVVLGGEPFATHTAVRSVYVGGRLAYQRKTTPKRTVIRAARVYTGTGEVIPRGAVLVEGGTVRGLGRDVSAPADAVVKRYQRAVVVPGLLDLSTGLGLGGPLTTAVGLQTRLGERLISGDPSVAVARQGGVTTVLLSSTGAGASPVVAFKLGDRPRVVQDPVAVRFGIVGNLTSQEASLRSTLQQAKTYADGWAQYEAKLAEYQKKKKEYDALKAKAAAAKKDAPKLPAAPKEPEKPRAVEALEPYRALFAGKIPALVEAHRADAIRLAVKIFRDEFKLRTVLLGADDAFRLGDLLAEKQVAVAVGPELVRTVEREPVNLAQVLANRGVSFAFQSKATTGVKTLPLAVQYAVHRGLGADDALAGLTAGPAKLLSIDKRVGTLAVGKDADLLVLSGPPFEAASRVLAVMIDGEWVYQEEEQR
ncbi:MAG TPA: amidohydrolase family protein, partial [Gemmataceae bacterium]|nr:amidohydrolase family protein [Gemmataceae bacterium]